MWLCGGQPAAAQTATPVADPFLLVEGTTRGADFSIHNTASEGLSFLGSITTTPPPFTFATGTGFASFTLLPGETRLVTDLFRLGSNGAPGDMATFQYSLLFTGVTSRSIYTAPGSMRMTIVPEPGTAALLLPAFGAIPLWKLRRKRKGVAA